MDIETKCLNTKYHYEDIKGKSQRKELTKAALEIIKRTAGWNYEGTFLHEKLILQRWLTCLSTIKHAKKLAPVVDWFCFCLIICLPFDKYLAVGLELRNHAWIRHLVRKKKKQIRERLSVCIRTTCLGSWVGRAYPWLNYK